MVDVFISYKSERRNAAEHLAEILADHGYSVWWDYGLVSGADFGPQIESKLRAAKAVIVLWCERSKASQWVRSEATLAKRLGSFLPARIENIELPLDFLLDQTIDLTAWDGAPQGGALQPLLRELAARVRAPAPNLEGLARTERAWRRFGAPSLAQFALIDPIETRVRERAFDGASEASAATPPHATTSPATLAWSQIADSLDPHDYEAFATHFPGTPEILLAARRKRLLDAWAAIDQTDPQAIVAFRKTIFDSGFDRLLKHTESAMDQAQRRLRERQFLARLPPDENDGARSYRDVVTNYDRSFRETLERVKEIRGAAGAQEAQAPAVTPVPPATDPEEELKQAEAEARRLAVQRSREEAERDRQQRKAELEAVAQMAERQDRLTARNLAEKQAEEERRLAQTERERRAQPGAEWRDRIPGLPEAACPLMVTIPPGKFLMGSPKNEERYEGYDGREEPQHEVRIDYAFALGKHELTVDAFAAFVAETRHDTGASAYVWNGKEWKDTPGKGWNDPGFAQTGRHPVCCVNWNDAKAYIAWLNSKLGLEVRADRYRLPSEAEWEYACRAGTATPFSFGATISTDQADSDWTYGAGQKGEYRKKTTPVGSLPANAFGLHDMHGNVWEWCEDIWHENYAGAPVDGSAWGAGGDAPRGVLRGGSWDDIPVRLRSASRSRVNRTVRRSGIGFRLARTV